MYINGFLKNADFEADFDVVHPQKSYRSKTSGHCCSLTKSGQRVAQKNIKSSSVINCLRIEFCNRLPVWIIKLLDWDTLRT
jgi:hypothetical protein